jgi:heme-degrading monooxygenase HmoA
MNAWKFLLGSTLWATFAVPPALAGQGGNVVEVVTFKLKTGVSAAEFAPIDKAVERQHVARQPGFVARESAHGADGEWLVIVHWRSAKDADASMATFEKASAAAPFMAKIEASTMSMKRYQR